RGPRPRRSAPPAPPGGLIISLPMALRLGRAGSKRESMKRLLLTGASLLALMAAAPADASTVFLYAGTVVSNFTDHDSGTYQIIAYGAQGGGTAPGKGAKISGEFSLTAGEVLRIAVGGAGASSVFGSGGGGGSFVIGPENQPLIIAGGGGGS